MHTTESTDYLSTSTADPEYTSSTSTDSSSTTDGVVTKKPTVGPVIGTAVLNEGFCGARSHKVVKGHANYTLRPLGPRR